MILTYDAYNETIDEKQIKDKEVESEKSNGTMQEAQREILDLLKGFLLRTTASIEVVLCPHDIFIRCFWKVE